MLEKLPAYFLRIKKSQVLSSWFARTLNIEGENLLQNVGNYWPFEKAPQQKVSVLTDTALRQSHFANRKTVKYSNANNYFNIRS
jgi:hypothetical protein